MRIALIGAGNLATNLGKALKGAGHNVVGVYSRTETSARNLANVLECASTNRLDVLSKDADVYVVAVKDSVLEQVVAEAVQGREDGLFLHTAGSMSMDCFRGKVFRYGVLYPMQTFSKDREVNFQEIPCFVEGCDAETLQVVKMLAESISERVVEMPSDRRKYVHLAAVWACNFANHCYDMASMLLEGQHIPFDVMLPLIDETARKVHILSPRQAQTGPAVRFDENVMRQQMELMAENPDACRLYEMLSKSIHQRAINKD